MFPDLLSNVSLPASSLASFILSLAIFPFYIRFLKAKQLGQFIREEGPASHATKAKTPTMGGAVFMHVAILVSSAALFLLGQFSLMALLVMAVAWFCGLLGLLDDLAKFQKRANAGLSARVRLLSELGLGAVSTAALLYLGLAPQVLLPGAQVVAQNAVTAHGLDVDPILFIAFGAFLVGATTNAVNLHDGMDGLAAGTSMQILSTMAVILGLTGQWPLAVVAGTAAGSIAAFLLFNRYPAAIFMGDTGSLFIGGLMAALALAGRIEIWFIPLTLLYIGETMSVMAQVTYFKLTKPYEPEKPMSKPALIWLKLTKRLPGEGKRLFRMAPLHHHFEAIAEEKGLGEWQVVVCFWLIQLAICLAVLACFFTGNGAT